MQDLPGNCRSSKCGLSSNLVGYKIKPTVLLAAGWRYLDVNYRPSSSFVYSAGQSDLLLGVTFNLK